MGGVTNRMRVERAREDASTTPLELFFDLVFVFALTQTTAVIADDLNAHGIVRGLLIFGLLWWSWVCYAWLGNVLRADEGVIRVAMVVAMATMFVLALSIPEAFDDLAGGLAGPVVVAVCYFVFRTIHLVVFWIVSRDDAEFHGQIVRFAPSMMVATTLLLVAAATDGAVQTGLWAAALAADYLGTYLAGARGWRLRSAGHFAERHGLILIIALGESIVAIGVGIAALPVSWAIVVGSVLGLALAAGLWWLYFDVTSLMAERVLGDAPLSERPRLARDAYSYLHLPMVAGIVLLAVGLKKVLEYVGDTAHHALTDPLEGPGLVVLVVGTSLYLLGLVAFKVRTLHTFTRARAATGVGLLVLIPAGWQLPALATLALLSAVVVGLVAWETTTIAETRYRIRHEQG